MFLKMTHADPLIARKLSLLPRRFMTAWGRALSVTLLMAACLPANAADQQSTLMPLPVTVVAGSGEVPIDGGLQVVFEGFQDARLDRARDRFLLQLQRRTGIARFPQPTAATPKLVIRTTASGKPVQELGEDESYRLVVAANAIELSAPTSLGTLHGLQTLLQLVRNAPQGYVIEGVRIDDSPRFPWRGLMIDVGRHFMPLDVIRQNLDLMEAAKLNVFHWHLSEDQGFRIESRRYPLLQEEGSDGQYYTQEEVRGILAYAHDRGIRVIPEFDMPGHATSWFVGYPDLASGHGPYEIIRKWGIFDPAMDPTRESTYTFLDAFIGEMAALFPDAYFHIGGDECNGKEWDANPRIQQFMRAHNLKDNAALQAYFTGRVQRLVTQHGKVTVGWDEVLQPGTPKDVVIQSWRGQDSLAQAARAGNRGLLSWGYYLDLNEPASRHFAVDPLDKSAAQLTPQEKARIVGGEAAEWTEFLTPEILTTRVWPRAAAVAERLWSLQSDTDVASMYRRLDLFEQNLAWYGSQPSFLDRPPFQRLVVGNDLVALGVLASVVEPPKEYKREELRSYTAYTPLNRLVDAIPAESREARDFSLVVRRIAAGQASEGDFEDARRRLTQWSENNRTLQPVLPKSALTAELVPVSRDLSRAATIGLGALDALARKATLPRSTANDDLQELRQMEAPRAVLLDQAIPSIEVLVTQALSQ